MVASASGEVRFYARADMAARLRVARALASDRPLTQEGKTLIAKRSYYEADQHAKAYEQKRDGRTFQVRRFVTVITDFAIALLLLGVVATAPRRWRGHFVIPPVVIALFALGWGVHIYRSGGTSLDEAAIKKYVAGHIAEDQGDAAAAMTEYRRAIPEYRRARRDFSAAIRLGGSYHDAYLERGFVLLSVGNLLPRGQAEPRYSTAAADFREATELDKSDFTAWNGLAVASWWQRKYSDALAAIDRAARLDPQDATVSFNRVEGLAVASSDNAEYKRQLVVFQNVLGKMRRDAVEATRFDLLDLKQSAEWDPRIKRAMKRVCRDLRRTAETVGVISRYNCGGLPAVQRSSTAWKS
jgi:tetratricopeptide (TPR) repeat protein